MGDQLSYIIYVSKEAFNFDDETLKQILKESRDWNETHNISGVLLYHAGNIMQVLEGTEEELKFIFGKIKGDKRHYQVTKIAQRGIVSRNFKDWSMAFRTATPELFADIKGYTELDKNLITENNSADDSILFLLKTFIAINPVSFR